MMHTITEIAQLPPARRRYGLTPRLREYVWGYFFIAPWIIGFLAFSLIPIAAVFYFSATQYSALSSPIFTGSANYEKLFLHDQYFYKSLINTVVYVAVRVPLHITFGFALAVALNAPLRGVRLLRTACYMPTIVPSVANAVLWMWILESQVGILNYVLKAVGLPTTNWLGTVTWAKPSLIVMSLWQVGSIMTIFLAGLQGIPAQLYEAAEIDGAGRWRKLFNITIPMMTPTILFNVILDIIGSFQVFTAAFIVTDGGPLNSTLFYVLYVYKNAFRYFDMGYASTLSVVLFILVAVLTAAVFRSSSSWVHYERL
jgi:multiple sugar transport system permease protein